MSKIKLKKLEINAAERINIRTSEEEIEELSKSEFWEVRNIVAQNEFTFLHILEELYENDTNQEVRESAINNENFDYLDDYTIIDSFLVDSNNNKVYLLEISWSEAIDMLDDLQEQCVDDNGEVA